MLFTLNLNVGVSADQTLNLGDTTVNILGQSGMMSVTIGGESSQVSVDYLAEVDVNGVQVGCSGNPKHCVNSFASQSFTFNTPSTNVAVGDTTASVVTFQSIIPTGFFTMTTMIINADGSISNSVPGGSTETLTLKKGDCKFNVMLSAWQWCTAQAPCSGGTGVGAFIDVTVTVKGKNADASWSSDNMVGTLGGSIITLSNTVVLDGVVAAMPSGYPMIGGNGNGNNKNSITFRFPKFTFAATYDPVLSAQTSLAWGYIVLIVVGSVLALYILYKVLHNCCLAKPSSETPLLSTNV